jgi:hypothetical protein
MPINKLLTRIIIVLFLIILFTPNIPAVGFDSSSYSITETDDFIVYLDNPLLYDRVSNSLLITRAKLKKLLNDSLRYKPEIFIVGSLAEFEQLVSGRFPDWGAAVAIPSQKMIVLKSPEKFNLNKNLEELLAHEYTHLLVSQKSGIFNPPRWLNEGLAMFVSMEWSWSYNLAMSKSAVFGQFIELKEIDKMNRFNESKAQVAYAESYLAVDFLNMNYSKNIFEKILNQINRGMVVEEAIFNETGMTLKEFKSEFKIYLNQRFNVLSLFMDTILLWLFLAIVVIVGFLLKFKKRRLYYKKWDEEEKLHSTDFEYGDSDNPEQTEDDDEPWRS